MLKPIGKLFKNSKTELTSKIIDNKLCIYFKGVLVSKRKIKNEQSA